MAKLPSITSETTQLAAQMAPEFKFGTAEITGASATHLHLFESARALTPSVGKAVTTGAAITMATGNLGLGALGALSVATYDVLSGGSKKEDRTPS